MGRSRSRDRYDDRDRDRGRRRRDRSRSRSRGRRRRDREPEGKTYYGRGLDEPGGGRPQDIHVPRDAKPDDLERIKHQTEIDDLTKDQRTVFVSQLVMKATEKQIRKFFEKIGKVKDVIMIRDKYTNRHKGYAYVELQELESVPMVLMLNGTVPDFQRFPILVKASEAEKNFLAKQEAAAATEESREIERRAAAPRRALLVGNLHPNITEGDLRTVLAPFGAVESVDMASVGPGSAVVTFALAEDASKASTRIVDIELGAGKPISVEFYDGPGALVAGGRGAPGDFDPNGGVRLSGNDKAALMASLGARAGVAPVPPPPPPQPAAPPPLTGPPTAAFVISNMFDPATETEPTWRNDIREDVSAECGKYGTLVHAHVDGSDPRGLVHILFADAGAADAAARALHGRWFAGRAITCTFGDPGQHRARFASEIPP